MPVWQAASRYIPRLAVWQLPLRRLLGRPRQLASKVIQLRDAGHVVPAGRLCGCSCRLCWLAASHCKDVRRDAAGGAASAPAAPTGSAQLQAGEQAQQICRRVLHLVF